MVKEMYRCVKFFYRKMKKLIVYGKTAVENNLKVRFLTELGIYDKALVNAELDQNWKLRIEEVIACPENELIHRVSEAGALKKGKQLMHNGIKILAGGYYGSGITQMLIKNKGVHEPQEEYVFDLVLKTIPIGATMLELGSYWAFYSIWFQKVIPSAKNYMVEPALENMNYGINNFRINDVKGDFTNAFVGRESKMENGSKTICVDDFIEQKKIDFIHILHSDIQGFELDMLKGSHKAIEQKKIGYIFISTHGNPVHKKCIEFLEANGFEILCEADINASYSYDGLVVARAKHFPGLSKIGISKNSGYSYEKIF